jgi:hypothetical protein
VTAAASISPDRSRATTAPRFRKRQTYSRRSDLTTVRALSFHATYRCRDSGACCSAGWPIPVEAERRPALLALLRDGSSLEELPVIGGHCVFHDVERHRCRAQAALGHGALPLACRQFPRVAVIDPRGVSVTLSHFCPTAAAMLDAEDPIAIVAGAAAFPDDGEYEGLDATAGLPPLLRPDMLMGWADWWLWEELSVATLARDDLTPAQALGALRQAVERVDDWSPRRGALASAIRDAFADLVPGESSPPSVERYLEDVMTAIPEEMRPATHPSAPPPSVPAMRRYLAAHAFANWTMHLGDGLRAWLWSLEAAHAVASAFGVRHADLLLRHLADPRVLADRLTA